MNLPALWEKIPVQIRTIINVCLGAAFAAAVTYGVGVVSGGTFNVSEFGTAILTAVGAVIVRLVNPGDSYGGIVAAPVPVAAPDPTPLETQPAPTAQIQDTPNA